MTHTCRWSDVWPTGHPLPPEDPSRLEGPELGALCLFRGQVVRVVARSYVWSPGECRAKGGSRLYGSSVIEGRDPKPYTVVVNDKDLTPISVGDHLTAGSTAP